MAPGATIPQFSTEQQLKTINITEDREDVAPMALMAPQSSAFHRLRQVH